MPEWVQLRVRVSCAAGVLFRSSSSSPTFSVFAGRPTTSQPPAHPPASSLITFDTATAAACCCRVGSVSIVLRLGSSACCCFLRIRNKLKGVEVSYYQSCPGISSRKREETSSSSKSHARTFHGKRWLHASFVQIFARSAGHPSAKILGANSSYMKRKKTFFIAWLCSG